MRYSFQGKPVRLTRNRFADDRIGDQPSVGSVEMDPAAMHLISSSLLSKEWGEVQDGEYGYSLPTIEILMEWWEEKVMMWRA